MTSFYAFLTSSTERVRYTMIQINSRGQDI